MNPIKYINTFWRSASVVRKFALALGSMLALILFVAVIGFVSLRSLEDKAADIVADSMRMQRLALEVDSKLQLARQAERDFIIRTHDLGVDGSRAVYAREFSDRLGEAMRNVAWLQEMERFSVAKRAEEKSAAQLEELHRSMDSYSRHFQQLVEMAGTSGVIDQAFERKTADMDSAYMRLNSQVRQLALSATDGARSASEGIAWYSLLAKYMLVASVLIALLLATSIIYVLNKTVAKSVVQLRDAATELSLGNLEARANVRGQDEFADVGMSINSMAVRMTALINNLESEANVASDRLLEAINSVSQGFLLFDRDEKLVIANRQVIEMTGGDSGFLKLGLPMNEVIERCAKSGLFVNAIGNEKEWAQQRINHMYTSGQESVQPTNDGRWVHTKVYHTASGEKVVLVSDVTEGKQKEQNLTSMNSDLEELVRDRTKVLVEKAIELKEANERLRELDELKSAFLSSVSHELRTPLTSLLGFSKIIKRDFNRIFMPLAEGDKALKLGTRIQSNLDIIGSEGERLTRLINDVLDLSRIEAGKEEWQFVDVDMAGAINRAVTSASGVFELKPQVQLVIRRFDMVPLVHGDPDRLQQVLINLLSNAAKFTESGQVAVDLYVDERSLVHIRIEDTGIGVEPQFLEKIFDKFHQAQNGDTLTEKPSGTGLGLAICRQIVEHCGGSIWAESQVGKGTTVHLTLPAVEALSRPLVLVVDDDEAARDYLGMVLKRAGYGVRVASDGAQALSMASQRKPALITMDIFMPGMDGRTTIARLREDENLADIPVLVVSVADDCHTAGGDAALLKPVNGDAFIDAVNSLLGEEASRPVLALTNPAVAWECSLPPMCGEGVTRCSEEEMWQQLGRGFEGTVVVPEAMAEQIDLAQICAIPHVQVLLLPKVRRAA